MVLPIILSLGAALVALLALGKNAGAAPPGEGYIPSLNDFLGAQNLDALDAWYEYAGQLYLTGEITHEEYTALYEAYVSRWTELAEGYVAEEIIVMFVDGTPQAEIDQLNASMGCTVIQIISSGAYRLAIPEGTNVDEMVALYLQEPIVEWAEPNYVDTGVFIGQEYRYDELPEKCVCDNCGYVLENPGEHCRYIDCPVCGERMWRVL